MRMIKLKELEFESGFNPNTKERGYDMIIEAHTKEDLDVVASKLQHDLAVVKAELKRKMDLLEKAKVVIETDNGVTYIVATVACGDSDDEDEFKFFNSIFDDTMSQVDMSDCSQRYTFD